MNDTDDPETEVILEASRFWVQRVLIPITVVIGIAGNTVTVMVLTRRRMRSSTNIYLSALAIADIIYLFFVFMLSFKHYPNIHDNKYELYWRFLGLMYWFCDSASSTSIWLTVSFTIERYIAVCHPMKGKIFCTERKAKSVIVVVYIFCILTTASTSFEYELYPNETCIQECQTEIKKLPVHGAPVNVTALNESKDKNAHPNMIENIFETHDARLSKMQELTLEPVIEKPPSIAEAMNNSTEWDYNSNQTMVGNGTCCLKHFKIYEQSTKLGKNETYISIMYWYSSLCFWLIPLALIATFNSFLIRAVYLSQKMRRQMTNSQESIGLSNEKRITVMLIGVVILFIICNTPTGSMLIYKNFHKPKNEREKNIILILGNFFNFLGIVNASCNFLIYCFFSKKFRSTFKKLFFERGKKKQDVIMLSSTKSKSSQRFNPYKHGIMRRNASEYKTPRNLETQSLTSIPRSKSLMARPIGKAKSTDLNT